MFYTVEQNGQRIKVAKINNRIVRSDKNSDLFLATQKLYDKCKHNSIRKNEKLVKGKQDTSVGSYVATAVILANSARYCFCSCSGTVVPLKNFLIYFLGFVILSESNIMFHEFVHMLIEEPIIQKYHVPQDLKERIVDLIFYEFVKKPIQSMFENSFANNYITVDAIKHNLPGAVAQMMADFTVLQKRNQAEI